MAIGIKSNPYTHTAILYRLRTCRVVNKNKMSEQYKTVAFKINVMFVKMSIK